MWPVEWPANSYNSMVYNQCLLDTYMAVYVYNVLINHGQHVGWSINTGVRKNGNGKNGNGTNGNGNNGNGKNGNENNGNMQNMEEMANLFYLIKYKVN